MGYETKYDDNKVSTMFSLCGCQNEVIVIQYDHEYEIADLCIYATYYHHKPSIWQKIRYIYQIIFVGYPYKDQTVLDKKQLKDMKKFLDTILN